MSKSKGVIITRIIVAVILLSLIVSCVYYFIIRAKDGAKNADNPIFASLNSSLNSTNFRTIDKNLGSLESGEYYSYAQTQGGLGYKEAYLLYYASREMLDAYGFRLISSHGDSSAVSQSITDVDNQAVILMRSQEVYNTTREAYGENPTDEERQALLSNFNTVVKDLAKYSECMYNLSNAVFNYVNNSYYEGLNAFRSAQYLYGYCLDKQSNLLKEAVRIDFKNVNSILYQESLLMTQKFVEVKNAHFVAQTEDSDVAVVIDYFLDEANDSFEELLNSKDKANFVQQLTSQTDKQKSSLVLIVLGLQGRLA